MENYSVLGNRIKRTNSAQLNGEAMNLYELRKSGLKKVSSRIVIQAYCESLKDILLKNSLDEIIPEIFHIEQNLNFLIDEVNESEVEYPKLDEFYKHLSPIFLQSILEHLDDHESREKVMKSWKEAIRIAIEEEIYIWQEKFFESR